MRAVSPDHKYLSSSEVEGEVGGSSSGSSSGRGKRETMKQQV